MKILLVNYEFTPQCGGAGLGTYNMANAFTRMGHKVALLIGWDYTFGTPENIDGVDITVIPLKKKNIQQSSTFGLIKYVLFGLKKINELTRKTQFDIVQFFFSVPTGILKYGIHGKIPYVVSLRGMDIPGLSTSHQGLKILTNGINKRITNGAIAITALSHEAARFYNAFSPTVKIDVIPNAVNCDLYRVKEKYSKDVSKFLCIARLIECKKLSLLIRAVKEVHETHPNVVLDIYGEGPDKEALEGLITSLSADKYVHLKGFYERRVLNELIADYDVFSLVSIGDSFGMVFIEAMAAGLPVVCARAGGPIDIVRDGENGIVVEPDDMESTIQALNYCIENPEKMSLMGIRGRQMAVERYSIGSIANQHIELYKRCVEGKL